MNETQSERQDSEFDGKYPLLHIRGLPFPKPFFSSETIEKVIDFKPNDSDIFIVTYPKCGTTVMQFIVWEIIHKGAVPPSPNQMMFLQAPFLEAIGIEVLENLPPPRIMKTHLPFNIHPYNVDAKYIYIVRNPWDVCVSYYYHHKMYPSVPKFTFDQHFEQFITGEVGWGDYFDHVLSWYKHKNDPNVLFLTYENIKMNKKDVILRVARFLGDEYYENLQDKTILQNCLNHTNFKYMKEMGMFFPKALDGKLDPTDLKEVLEKIGQIDRSKVDPDKFQEVNFFRKGEIGDWKNHFSPEQIQKFNEYMNKKLKNTEMENFWPPLMDETSL